MTTESEALEVLTVVAACHPRTAIRPDDAQAVRATATVWAELFSRFDLTVADLVAAVKSRAATIADAPEAADIIRVARAARQDKLGRDQALPLGGGQQHEIRPSHGEPPIPEASKLSHLENKTPRLIAAQDALGWCQGREESRAAIREYQAALAEYRGKPLTVAEAPLAVDVLPLLAAQEPPHYQDPSEPRHPIDEW